MQGFVFQDSGCWVGCPFPGGSLKQLLGIIEKDCATLAVPQECLQDVIDCPALGFHTDTLDIRFPA